MNPNLFRYTPAKSQYKLPNPQEFEDLSLKIEKSISSALNLISRHKTSPRKENIIVPNDKVGISIYDTTNNMSNAVQNLSEASQNLHQLAKSISKLTKSYKVKKQMSVSELT